MLPYSFLLPVLGILIFRSSLKDIAFWGLLGYGLLFFSLNFFFDDIMPITGKRLYYFLYTLFECLTFTFLIFHSFKGKKRIIITVSLLTLGFCCFQILHLLFAEQKKLDSIPIGVLTVLQFMYILYYIYYYFFKQEHKSSLISQNTFWFAIGILIYLAGTFFFHLLIDYLPMQQIRAYWFITYIFDIIKNIFFTIAIFVHIRQANKKPQAQKTNEPFLNFL